MRPYNSVVDLNGDGRTDIVLSGDSNGVALGNGQRTSVAWLENPGSLGQFTSHAIAEPQEGTPVITAAIAIGDLDGDGDSDTAAIIGGRRFDWFENTGGRYPSWKPHTVVAEADNIYFRNLAVGDIESGHADIIVARSTDNMGSVDGHFVLYTRQ